MTNDLSSYGISLVSQNGDITLIIGGSDGSAWGYANGIGGYFYRYYPIAYVFSNHAASLAEFQGVNATVERIARALAGTACHEIGHVLNLYHAYHYESYDPYDSGALNNDYLPQDLDQLPPALKSVYEADFVSPDSPGYRIMSDETYLSDNDRATFNRYYSECSKKNLDFYTDGGGTIGRNLVIGLFNMPGTNQFEELPVTQNVTIPSSRKLLLPPGSKYEFNQNIGMSVEGTLTVYDGVQLKNVTGNWGGIDVTGVIEILDSGLFSGAPYIEYATTGVDVYNASPFSISAGDSLTIKNCSTAGIHIHNCSPTIERVHIESVSGSNGGIYVEGGSSSPILQDITIKSCQYGVKVGVSANANLYRHHHYSNGSHCILLNSDANLSMENASGIGNNSIMPGGSLAISNDTSNGTILADWNHWGTPNPTGDLFGYGAYVDDYDNHYDYHVNATGAGASKIASPDGFRVALMYEENGDNTMAYDAFREYLVTESDPQMKRAALKAMLRIADKTGRDYSDLTALIADEQKNYTAFNTYRAVLDYIACDIPNRSGNTSGAIVAFTNTVPVYAGSPMEVEMLCRIAELYGESGNREKALEYAAKAATVNPGQSSLMSAFAAAGKEYNPVEYTDRFSDWDGVYKQTGSSDDENAEPNIVPALTVTPNPANPSTTIHYTITRPGNVSLAVYSVSGQKVATLVDGFMPAGTHAAVFDGSSLASGLYLYRFEAKGFAKTGKIVLVK